ncbi:MAG: RluA family pseudouridine synthase [Phycisphaerales bacterium]
MTTIEPNPRVTFGVAYEDDELAVVVKPARVVTQPGVGHEHDTLLNGLFARWGERLEQMGERRDHGLVHRLDRETSGLVIVALSRRAYDGVREQFAQREVSKFYWAVTHKPPREPTGVIKRPIIEVLKRNTKYTSQKLAKISASGKPAVTAYRVLAESPHAALVEARPVTGRLHQVRVHLDLIGCAIMGDTTYGPKRASEAALRLALHAHRIGFEHPVTGERVDVRTKWPQDLRGLLRKLQLPRPDLPVSAGGILDDGPADEAE